mgnify:CR=1 FL=1
MNTRPVASDSVSTRRSFLTALAAAGVALPLSSLAAEKKKEKAGYLQQKKNQKKQQRT